MEASASLIYVAHREIASMLPATILLPQPAVATAAEGATMGVCLVVLRVLPIVTA